MTALLRSSAALLAATAVAGCVDATGTEVAAMRTAPAADEVACLQYVAGPLGANNPTVIVLGSETSEANNVVMVGVDAQRAPWRCLVNGGVVAEVTYVGGDEGYL